MQKLTITGIPPYDGSYSLDIGGFTGRELHTIKEISGVRAGELTEAFAAGDNDLLIATAAILLGRAGHQVNVDTLMDAPQSAFGVIGTPDDVEDEERPPARATTGGEPKSNGAVVAENEPNTPSGGTSTGDGEGLANDPSPTGSHGLGMPAAFHPRT